MSKKGKSSYLLLSVLSLALLGLTGLSRLSGGIVDDAEILRTQGSESQFRSVQGATSTTNDDACPEDKPIIGWINYEGQKTVRFSIPEGEFASACFDDVDDALAAGYLER